MKTDILEKEINDLVEARCDLRINTENLIVRCLLNSDSNWKVVEHNGNGILFKNEQIGLECSVILNSFNNWNIRIYPMKDANFSRFIEINIFNDTGKNIAKSIIEFIEKSILDWSSFSQEDIEPITFEMSKLETARAQAFINKHKHKDRNHGAIGGHISYRFTPTSIGTCVNIECSDCGESENITDYDSF